jgi:hypothetical protein
MYSTIRFQSQDLKRIVLRRRKTVKEDSMILIQEKELELQLCHSIEALRSEMNAMAAERANHMDAEVIEVSQELDRLLVKYHRLLSGRVKTE